MKRFTLVRSMASLVLVALLATACGSTDKNNSSGPAAGGGNPAPSASFTTVKKGFLTVGSCLDYPPFEYYKKGHLKGFDVDVVEAVAKKLNLKVQWVKSNFNTIFNAVSAHKFDMVAAASTITPERKKVVNFSEPYYNALLSLTINKDKTPTIKSTDDLKKGDIVGVQKGTTNAIWATQNLEPKGIQIKSFTSAPDAMSDLESGRIVGVINDQTSSISIVKNRPSLQVVQPIQANQNYGFAFAPDTPQLTVAVNGALEALINDGSYETIYHRYFPGVPVPKEFQPK
jgi:ABC-type amino acid transport substrate-binding protein